MGKGFGLIVTKDLRYLWIEPDFKGDVAHPMILARAGIMENSSEFLRHFVRVEFPTWKAESFRFDEEQSLPGWCEENRGQIEEKCCKILEQVAPIWREHESSMREAKLRYSRVQVPAKKEYEQRTRQAKEYLLSRLRRMKGHV